MIKKSKENELTLELTFKDILLFKFLQATGKLSTISELTAEEVEEGEKAIQRIIYLIQSKIITSIDIDPKAGTLKFKVSEVVDKKVILPAKLSFTVVQGNTTTKELDTLFSTKAVKLFLNSIAQELFKITKGDKLHKQPRGYLKTTAKLVGRATDNKTLFTLPEVVPESGGNFLREVISRNTAILGNYLLQLWQQNGGKELVIDNLSPIAEMMGNSNYEIKIYLLYLGGYVYPIIDKDKDGLTLTTEQLFKIQFRYSRKVADKYDAGNYTEIGGGLTKFIKDEPIDSITIKPSPLFIKALEGKGLGNVLVVNDKFVKLALSLTDIAYKIFTYSASNKPSQKIAEDNLIRHLGLEKQIKTQGRPRVRATILKGLQELKDKEHIKSYKYEEATGMYLFTYSDKYVKHQEAKKDI